MYSSSLWGLRLGSIGINGIVKNVNIGNGYLETGSRTGGICGVSFGRIENCTNLATINSQQDYHVGGICGINRAGVIINCTNSAKVSGKNAVGGVCGLNGSANNNTGYIQKCYNFGNVLGLGFRTGGVIGWNGSADVLDCFNEGVVEGIGDNVGGVIGAVYNINRNVLVENCHNTGAVTGGASYVGGVCGYANSSTVTNADSTTTTYTPTISNCWNSGVIENIGNAAYSDVGGLLGYSSFTYINSCFNYGNVYGYGHCVGGILGRGKADLLLCINYGLISGDSDSQGGIVGHLNAGGTLEKCINYGAVSGFKNYIAGLVAHNSGKMYNSYNAGHVFGDGSYVGGVCGVNNTAGNGEGFIYNCFNLGVIKGIKNVGGVVGVSYQSNSTDSNKPIIKNCYNFGGVSATSFVAGVISENRTTSTLTATYYWSAFCSTGIGSGSGTATAVTASNYTTAMNALNSNVTTNNSNASNIKWLTWQIDATGCPSFVE